VTVKKSLFAAATSATPCPLNWCANELATNKIERLEIDHIDGNPLNNPPDAKTGGTLSGRQSGGGEAVRGCG